MPSKFRAILLVWRRPHAATVTSYIHLVNVADLADFCNGRTAVFRVKISDLSIYPQVGETDGKFHQLLLHPYIILRVCNSAGTCPRRGCNGPDFGIQDQGAIMVETTDRAGAVIGGPITYNTPTRAGFVTVVGAVGERLTLRAEDGTLFTFDVPSRQWVNP